MPPLSALRDHLLELLRGGQAHISFDNAVKDFPIELAGIRPDGAPPSLARVPARKFFHGDRQPVEWAHELPRLLKVLVQLPSPLPGRLVEYLRKAIRLSYKHQHNRL